MDNQTNTPSQIFKSIKDKYLILIGIAVFLIFFLTIAFASLFSSQNNNPEVNITVPTPVQSQRTSAPIPTVPGFSSDINIEQTAKDSGPVAFVESSELASQSIKETLPDGSVKYMYESLNPLRSDITIVKNGSIIFMRHAVVGANISAGYKNLLGKQDTIVPGPTYYGPNTVTYFYTEGGTALIVDPQTETTFEEFTFQPPISLEEFMSNYKVYTQ